MRKCQRYLTSSVSVIGLGKLGLPILTAIASRGFKVIGVDVNRDIVDRVNAGIPPVFEPKLSRLLSKNNKRIKATTDYQEAINNSGISFIVVPTPSKRDGSFSNRYILAAIKSVGQALRSKKEYHLVSIVSTVSPASFEKVIKPVLEKHSDKKVGEDVGLCYNPSFIALGSVIENLLFPDFVLIGESDPQAGKLLANFYKKFCRNRPPIVRMNFINSEITKIALNTFITTKISFANMLASLCQQVKGGDVDVVTQALGLDSRIGGKYLKGAVAYGGPCFPRDNRALIAFGKQKGVSLLLPQATDKINQFQTKEIARLVTARLTGKKTVGILGLSYKPNTDVIEESQGLLLAKYLIRRGYKVFAFDPIKRTQKVNLNQQGIHFTGLKELVRACNAIIITTPWPEFKQEIPRLLTKNLNKMIILVDCWRIVRQQDLPKQVLYIGRGRGPQNKES